MWKKFMVGFFLTDREKEKIADCLEKILRENYEGHENVFVELSRCEDEHSASKVAESANKRMKRTISVIKIDIDDIFERSKGP